MNWRVERKKFVLENGTLMAAGCHHHAGRTSACGGCYARLSVLIQRIETCPDRALEMIAEVSAARKAESKAAREATP